jgi:hypothetical protein
MGLRERRHQAEAWTAAVTERAPSPRGGSDGHETAHLRRLNQFDLHTPFEIGVLTRVFVGSRRHGVTGDVFRTEFHTRD